MFCCLLLRAPREFFFLDVEVCSLESFRESTARLGVKTLQIADNLLEMLHYAYIIALGVL